MWSIAEVSVKYRSSISQVSVKYRSNIGESPSISTDRSIGRYIGRYSTDISTCTRSNVDRYSVEYRQMYRVMYRLTCRSRPPIRYMIPYSSLMNWDDLLMSSLIIICTWDHDETNKLSVSLRTERKEMKMFIESNFCIWSELTLVWGKVTSSIEQSDFWWGQNDQILTFAQI